MQSVPRSVAGVASLLLVMACTQEQPPSQVPAPCLPAPAPAVVTAAPAVEPEAPTFDVLVGTGCPDGTRAVAGFMEEWIAKPNALPPSIEYRAGVVFVHSEEDRGDDARPPRSAAAESMRACGSAALWLRSHLRERLLWQELTCCGTTCTYPGMEYAPNGTIELKAIDRYGQPSWALVSWSEAYVAALGEEYANRNLRYVEQALAKHRGGRCAGEPAGLY